MIKLTPIQLQRIIEAANYEIAENPTNYNTIIPIVTRIKKWLTSIDWNEPNTEVIMIDELPF